jgi:lipopolysaccharide transport system ATP-binding protein
VGDIAVCVENLSKQYQIGVKREGYTTLRDTLTDAFAAPFRKAGKLLRGQASGAAALDGKIWALKDVTFEIERGQIVGVIGSNGAGKSTLLKVLSRITEPTMGYCEIRGRVGCLLEVGSGFHPELTGRENIYLYGAILGMRRYEIACKFDEIVAFAEVEKFIDTPLKHYSSGMYMRLAFAVAAHLESEILLVDEVLAVGDASFQKKCLGKMGDVASGGRTVMFVSHNMHAISLLCESSILLSNGRVAAYGRTAQIVEQYLSSESNQAPEAIWSFDEAPGTYIAKLHSVKARNEKSQIQFDMRIDEPIKIEAQFWILSDIRVEVSFHVYNQQGLLLFATGNFHDSHWKNNSLKPGLYACSCTIPENYLNEGIHYIKVYLHHGNDHKIDVVIPEVISFNVLDLGDSRGDWTGYWLGLVRPILPWTGERIGALP